MAMFMFEGYTLSGLAFSVPRRGTLSPTCTTWRLPSRKLVLTQLNTRPSPATHVLSQSAVTHLSAASSTSRTPFGWKKKFHTWPAFLGCTELV